MIVSLQKDASYDVTVHERFLEAIARDDKPRKPGLHVSDLAKDCLRCSWFRLRLGDFQNPYTMLTFWKGRKLHETALFEHHELELEWRDIHGTIDEYEDGALLDKKTTTKLPERLPDEYRRQIEYYTVLLRHNGHPVKTAHVLFFDLTSNQTRLFTVEDLRTQEQIEQEMLERKKILQQKQPPDRNVSAPYCLHCPYGLQCFSD